MMVEMRMVALADDLTGALEVGAKFTACGAPAMVVTGDERPNVPVLVIDTETRHLTPDRAAEKLRKLAPCLKDAILYKKTDSTLRGNIAAEIGALLAMFPGTTVVYAPAYPAMGRTVRDGRLYVHGIPLHDTEFARDPLNPITTSDVASLFTPRQLEQIEIVDGETWEDMRSAAGRVRNLPGEVIAAGPAALAASLAEGMELPPILCPRPSISRCLVVNGSLHPTSIRQIQTALHKRWDDRWEVLKPAIPDGLSPLELAGMTGRYIRERILETDPDALVVFGGDTAFAILEALGCTCITVLGELLEGVPLSLVAGPHRDLHLITKAGGFGDIEILPRIRAMLDVQE